MVDNSTNAMAEELTVDLPAKFALYVMRSSFLLSQSTMDHRCNQKEGSLRLNNLHLPIDLSDHVSEEFDNCGE